MEEEQPKKVRSGVLSESEKKFLKYHLFYGDKPLKSLRQLVLDKACAINLAFS